ncbi:MAG: gephyrin-like molybdotransferase Glp [Pirellulales bacterium]
MLSVDEAFDCLCEHARSLPVKKMPLEGACGLKLTQAAYSLIESPSFDKSMVDGYALRVSDTSPTLQMLEQVTAGQVPHHAVVPGTTIRVMTGAPVPDGADAVVKWEDTTQLDEETIYSPLVADTGESKGGLNQQGGSLGGGLIKSGYCILPRGTIFQAGQQLLAAGTRLGPVDLGLLAEIGQFQVSVVPRPRVAVMATGNELVDGEGPLASGQIRNSNGPMLLAALRQEGLETVDLGIGRDNVQDLRTRIELGLDADVLLISGGVSAGVLDLVPGVLEALGVRQVFHKVQMKPGKPLWFGVRESGARRTLVFGLPGNPVSTLVAFHLFVKPAIEALSGEPFAPQSPVACQLTAPMAHRGNRPSYQPCKIDAVGSSRVELPSVAPLVWRGSADLATLASANGLAMLPPGDYQLDAGSQLEVLVLDERQMKF